ncbi:MAG: hypothetical protein RBU37_26085, partial [Myxococcota bacterium]|nr:hypothetical protein [Myxococcota bacterium]
NDNASQICREAFTAEDWSTIIGGARELGPALLVFLRSVESLSFEEIDKQRLTQRLAIRVENPDDARPHRQAIVSALGTEPASTLLERLRTYSEPVLRRWEQSFSLDFDGHHEEQRWRVVTGLFNHPELLDAAESLLSHEQRAVPWAGAAAPVGSDGSNRGVACFLPLPLVTVTKVWLHGFFDVIHSRQDLTRPVAAGIGSGAQARLNWNTALFRWGAGPAYAMLVEDLRGEAATNVQPYTLFPESTNELTGFEQAMLEGFYGSTEQAVDDPYRGVFARDVFRYERLVDGIRSIGWDSCIGKWDAGAGELDLAIQSILLSAGEHLPTPDVPEFVRAQMQHINMVLHPSRIRDCLFPPEQDLPEYLSDRENVVALTRFFLQSSVDLLEGLPLALLANGGLAVFGAQPLFRCPFDRRVLLEALPSECLDTHFAEVTGLRDANARLGIHELALEVGIRAVGALIAQGSRTVDHVSALFRLLAASSDRELARLRTQLDRLPILPKQDGWGTLSDGDRPLLVESETLAQTLDALGVPVLRCDDTLRELIRNASSKHRDLDLSPSPASLARSLATVDADKTRRRRLRNGLRNENRRNAVLAALSESRWVLADIGNSGQAFRQIPLLPTRSGHLVTANQPGLYLPTEFRPPSSIPATVTFLVDESRWSALYSVLGIPRLDLQRFVDDLLSPAFDHPESSPDAKITWLTWLRDRSSQLNLLSLRTRRCIPLANGDWTAPGTTLLFLPTVFDDMSELFGNDALQPALQATESEQKSWNSFFEALGLSRQPSSVQLQQRIHALALQPSAHGPIQERDAFLLAIGRYLSKNWTAYQSMQTWLQSTAWIPVGHQLFRPNQLLRRSVRVESGQVRTDTLVGQQDRSCPFETPDLFAGALQFRSVSVASVLANLQAKSEGVRPSIEDLTQIYCFLATQQVSMPAGRLLYDPEHSCWREAQNVFFSLPVAIRVAGRVDARFSAEGLRRLGVRQTPTCDDWLRFLSSYGADPLENNCRNEIDAIYVQILNSSPKALPGTTPILCQNNCLRPANDVFVDDFRQNRAHNMPNRVAANQGRTKEIARLAGCRGLRSVLRDRLVEVTKEQNSPDWVQHLVTRLRSRLFAQALATLAEADEADEGSWRQSLQAFSVSCASLLRIQLHFQDEAQGSPRDTSLFLARDNAQTVLWVIQSLKQRDAIDACARELARLVGEEQRTLELCRLLDWERCSENELVSVAEQIVDAPLDSEVEVDAIPTSDEEALHEPSSHQWTQGDHRVRADERSPSNAGQRSAPSGSAELSSRSSESPSPSSRREGASRAPNHGTVPRSWTADTRERQLRRFLGIGVGALSPTDPDGPVSTDSSDDRNNAEARYRAVAELYERNHGRTPTPMALNQRGFDLESRNAEGALVRRIEVKGRSGPWANGELVT